ncbi:ABC transporter ATP-binding protein/permease [Roseibacterium sp. SDUM158016]|nr:ABC transporter ATP-binding protein/permease [Roseibacterium sp. SDUM158016]
MALVTLGEAVAAILGLWLIKLLIDVLSAPEAFEDGIWEIYLILGGAGLVTFIALVVQSYGNLLRSRQGMMVADYIDREIHDRAIEVDLGFYESPAYFDSLQRARQAGPQRPAQMVSGALVFSKSVIFLAAILVMLAGIEWKLLPVLLFTVVVALIVRLYFTRRLYQWQYERAQLERRASYFDWLLTSDLHAKELRLHGLGGYFRNVYSNLRRDIRAQQLKIETTKSFAEIGVAAVGAAAFIGAITFLISRTVAGDFTLGDIVLFVLLFRRAEQSGQQCVSSLSGLFENQLYLSQLFSFLEVKPNIQGPAEPAAIPRRLERGLVMDNVSFRYRDADHDTLKDVSLEVPPGRLVALVGENGSGKTTLIKLLTRLYDPDSGRITLDGIDVREFDPLAYRRLFSVIFQDFAKYAATAADNIWFGDVAHPRDDEKVLDASDRAGASSFLRELPKGFDTPLSRIFDDGQELSIGQWQRVALARAFLPNTRFIIMDEPTSAVDPRAEMELFDTLRDRIGDRGALIISHRLSTIRHVDYTYVLDDGRMLEHGTHEELLAKGGRYASLFGRQAAYFK